MTSTDPIASDHRALLALAELWDRESNSLSVKGAQAGSWEEANRFSGAAYCFQRCAKQLRAEIDRLQPAAKGGKE